MSLGENIKIERERFVAHARGEAACRRTERGCPSMRYHIRGEQASRHVDAQPCLGRADLGDDGPAADTFGCGEACDSSGSPPPIP